MKLNHVRRAWLRRYNRTKDLNDHPAAIMHELPKFGGRLVPVRLQWTPKKEARIERRYERKRITALWAIANKGANPHHYTCCGCVPFWPATDKIN